jgi:hypothetical protein
MCGVFCVGGLGEGVILCGTVISFVSDLVARSGTVSLVIGSLIFLRLELGLLQCNSILRLHVVSVC